VGGAGGGARFRALAAGLQVRAHAPGREEQPVLRHVAEAAVLDRELEARRGVEQHALAERDPPCADRAPAGDGLEQRRLARARRTEHAEAARRAVELHVEDEVRERDAHTDRGAHHGRRSTPRASRRSTRKTPAKASTTHSPTRPSAARASPSWISLKIASASVCVRPGMLPATITVAPNSPSARLKA